MKDDNDSKLRSNKRNTFSASEIKTDKTTNQKWSGRIPHSNSDLNEKSVNNLGQSGAQSKEKSPYNAKSKRDGAIEKPKDVIPNTCNRILLEKLTKNITEVYIYI